MKLHLALVLSVGFLLFFHNLSFSEAFPISEDEGEMMNGVGGFNPWSSGGGWGPFGGMQPFGSNFAPFGDMFGGGMQPGGGGGSGGGQFSSFGSGGNFRQMSSSTRFNGNKKITTQKINENGKETVLVYENDVLKSKTVDGVPQSMNKN